MTRVVVNGNMDGALRKFKQRVAISGVPSEFKKIEHFPKPGVERRAAIKEAIKNVHKNCNRDYWEDLCRG